jgi:hypothetical protein
MKSPTVAFTSRYSGLSNALINKVYVAPVLLSPSKQIQRPPDAHEYNALCNIENVDDMREIAELLVP